MKPDLFARRFREVIAFLNFVEGPHPETAPLQALCAVPFALQNRALLEEEKRAKRCRNKGRKRGGQRKGGKKEERTREKKSEALSSSTERSLTKAPLKLCQALKISRMPDCKQLSLQGEKHTTYPRCCFDPPSVRDLQGRFQSIFIDFFCLDRADGRGGFGSQTAADPLWRPPQSS